jgi:hypothetical protein
LENAAFPNPDHRASPEKASPRTLIQPPTKPLTPPPPR